MRLETGYSGAAQINISLSRLIDTGNEIKDRGLACAVGPDQTSDLAGFNLQIVVVDGPQPPKVVAHFLNPKQRHPNPLFPAWVWV